MTNLDVNFVTANIARPYTRNEQCTKTYWDQIPTYRDMDFFQYRDRLYVICRDCGRSGYLVLGGTWFCSSRGIGAFAISMDLSIDPYSETVFPFEA
jgi:hypothetical protein